MKIGDKVKARYTDATGVRVAWTGVLKEQVTGGWLVTVGSVAIVFNPADIEVIDEQKASG